MTAAQEPTPRGPRVLVVEDDPLNRRLMTTMLASLDCQVEEAESGDEAWDLLERQAFDRMFLDIRMPGMSGIELAAKLRASDGLNHDIPVVAVSGDVMRTLAQYRQAGFDAMVEKPISFGSLRAGLETLRRSTDRATASQS